MVGGLLQLSAKGSQDIYLTGNPQMTFFKTVYRRYTNFSIESIRQIFDDLRESSTSSCKIARKGDLLYKIYIQQEIPTGVPFEPERLRRNYGFDFIKEVSVIIGSQTIDKHTNNWMETYTELTQPNEYGNFTSAHNALFMNSAPNIGMGHTNGNNVHHTATKFQSMTMAGGVDAYESISYFNIPNTNNVETSSILIPTKTQVTPNKDGTIVVSEEGDQQELPFYELFRETLPRKRRAVNDYAEYLYKNEHHYIYTPLQFWFCRNIGLALPLIALQYDEVILNFNFGKFMEPTITPELWVDYIFLDTDERRRFAQISHEYLIEQVDCTKRNLSMNEPMLLRFNNPVKEIIWVNSEGVTADYGGPLIGKWSIQINSYDRISERDISYFTKQQINDYHTGYGGVTVRNSIAVYSFALNPEDHQPSGTINMSTINNFYLYAQPRNSSEDLVNEKCTVYAVNYNILRILSGQGKLGYTQ
jgi:hypothetical protein